MIFLGISLAIWFNNWNDHRKERATEKNVLSQIYTEIKASLGDIENDLSVLDQSLKSHYKILDALNSDQAYEDGLAFDFYFLQKDEYTYPIRTTYERIKMDGLEIISNDSLRYVIERLYEFGIPRIDKSEAFFPDISEHFKPFYIKNFRPNTDLGLSFILYWADGDTTIYPRPNRVYFREEKETIGYVPLDFQQLKKSTEFKMLMSQTLEYRLYKIRQFNRIKFDSEYIMNMIEGILGKENLR